MFVELLVYNNQNILFDMAYFRLITGPLQVVDGTHLILDTTEIEPGVLNAVGSANVKSLKNVCELQKVIFFLHCRFT